MKNMDVLIDANVILNYITERDGPLLTRHGAANSSTTSPETSDWHTPTPPAIHSAISALVLTATLKSGTNITAAQRGSSEAFGAMLS